MAINGQKTRKNHFYTGKMKEVFYQLSTEVRMPGTGKKNLLFYLTILSVFSWENCEEAHITFTALSVYL